MKRQLLHVPYVLKHEQPVLSSAGSETSSASRLSITSTAVDRQAPSNAAAAEHLTAAFGGNFALHPEIDWSDKPLLACGPAAAAAADSNAGSGSTFGAGEWRQAGFRASNQHHQALVGEGPDAFEHRSAANWKAVASPQLQTDHARTQSTNLHSTPPLAQDMGYSSMASSAQPPAAVGQSTSAALCQSRTPAPTASLASRASTSSCSSSSQQDSSVVLHSASTSASSFYTHADSVVRKACSSPRHTGASASCNQHHKFLQAPRRDVEAAASRAVHVASVQQGSTTSQIALTAYQVCGSADSFGFCLHTAPD